MKLINITKIFVFCFFINTDVLSQPDTIKSFDQISNYKSLIFLNKDNQYISAFNIMNNRGGSNWAGQLSTKIYPILFEANLSPIILLTSPKFYKKESILKQFITTFEFQLKFRMDTDNSNPIRPANFNPRIAIYYFMDKYDEKYKNLNYFKIEFDHLSNGQQDSSHLLNGNINYISGNYSTNYFKISYFNNKLLNNNGLISNGLSYRYDVSVGGPFVIDPSQRFREARSRINFQNTLALNNIKFSKIKDKRKEKTIQITYNNINEEFILDSTTFLGDGFKVDKFWNLRLRTDFEYQVGNLNKFNYYSSKYRFGLNTFLTIQPTDLEELQFFTSFYFGRDYMNIRYTDIIKIFQIGLSLPIQKYQPKFQLTNLRKISENNSILINSNSNIISDQTLSIKEDNIFIFNGEYYKINFASLTPNMRFDSSFYPTIDKKRNQELFNKIFVKLKL